MDLRLQYFAVKMWVVFFYVISIGVFCLVVKYFWQRRKLYWLGYHLDGPPTVFLLGNSLLFNCKEDDLFQRMCKVIDTYSNPIRFWLGPKLVIVIKTAADIEKVLTSPIANDKDDIYRFFKVFNGLSLFTTNGSSWRKCRKYVTPILGKKYMECYLERIKKCCSKLVQKLDVLVDTGDFCVDHYLYRCYNDIVIESLTGHNPTAQDGCLDGFIKNAHEAYILLHERMMKVWLHPDVLFNRSSNGKRQKFLSNVLRDLFSESIRLSKQSINNNEGFISVHESLLQIQEKNETYKNVNIMDQVITLFSASEDTTTTICSFLLMILGMYPDVQDKVVQEIREVTDENIDNLTYKQLTELKYLDMCVKEVIRLFPIGPYILRKLNDDLDLENVTLPKNTTIALSFYHVQRSKEHWERPNEFYPEHFLPEFVSARHPYAFLPFSAGPRSCPGQMFAYAAIKAVAVWVLQNFIVEAKGKIQDITIKGDISIRPIKGYNLSLRRR